MNLEYRHQDDIEAAVGEGEGTLPGEVQALLTSLGLEIAAVHEITRLTSPLQQKRNFMLDITDGRRLKARVFPTHKRQQRVVALFPLLAGLPFSGVLAHGGRVTLEEWIEGRTLDPGEVNVAQARRAGEILGTLHTRGGYAPSFCEGMPDTAAYLHRLERHLAVLRHHGAASQSLCQRLAALAEDQQPGTLDSGLIHADFCVENMILTPAGELFLVDNEDLRVGVLDYDLARCWSRWPMGAVQRSAFCEGYGSYRSLATFTAHARFWGVIALVTSLQVFLRHGRSRPALQAALGRLVRDDPEDFWPQP